MSDTDPAFNIQEFQEKLELSEAFATRFSGGDTDNLSADLMQSRSAIASLAMGVLGETDFAGNLRYIINGLDVDDDAIPGFSRLLGEGNDEPSKDEVDRAKGLLMSTLGHSGVTFAMEQDLKAEIEMTTVLADEMSVSRAEIIRSDKLYNKLKRRMYVSPLLQLQKGIYNLRGRFADMGGVEGIAKNVLVDIERSDRPFADDYTIEQFAEGVASGLEELLRGTENEGLLDIGNLPLKENELMMLHEDTLSVWGLSGLNDEYWDELQEQAILGGFVFKRPPKTIQQLALEMQLQVARELELSDNPEDWSFADKMDISFELGQKGYNRDGTPKRRR